MVSGKFFVKLYSLFGTAVVIGDLLDSTWWLTTVYGIPVWAHFIAVTLLLFQRGQGTLNEGMVQFLDRHATEDHAPKSST